MATALRPADVDRLVDVIGDHVAASMIGPQKRLKEIVDEAHLPRTWTGQVAGVWTGDSYYDTRQLIKWAQARGLNPDDKRYTTLGAVLTATLGQLGLEEQAAIAATLLVYDLVPDRRLREELRRRYAVPEPPQDLGDAWTVGPEEGVWSGGDEELEPQAWLRPEPDLLDVAFLARAIQRSAAICRVETSDGRGVGSGFLVGPQHALTNHHVIGGLPGQAALDPGEVILRFGYTEDAEGEPVKLVGDNPVPRSSPMEMLDFALLELESALPDRDPLAFADRQPPQKGNGLHILQHPKGAAMKVGITANGVSDVEPAKGLLHYVTTTAGGSSGSPCFDDDWNLVALHHGERRRAFGAMREGILFGAIHPQIEPLL